MPLILVIVCVIFLVSWGFRTDKNKAGTDEARLCSNCGYDLRGGHDRCPECGEFVPRQDDDDAGGIYDDMFLASAIELRNPEPSENLVYACDVGNTVEAAFLTQLLENHGITVVREGQARPTDYQPVAMRLMVWSNDGDAAAALIKEVRRRQAARRGSAAPR